MKTNFKVYLFSIIQLLLVTSSGHAQGGDFHFPNSRIEDQKKADSIYNLAMEVNINDEDYNKALLFRNEYGWQLNKLDQLKIDLPEILKQEVYKAEFKYQHIFNPQDYPPTFWQQFYSISIELKNYFEVGTLAYRENLALLVYLEVLLNNNTELLKDLSELLGMIQVDSDNYFIMLWQYGMAQVRDGQEMAAIATFEKGFTSEINEANRPDFAFSLVNLYSVKNMYDKVIEYEEYIIEDTSGTLLFYLGEAYSQKGQNELASNHFENYTKHFQKDEYSGMLFTDNGSTLNPVRPIHLEVLGDFYRVSDKTKACEYYNLGIEILSQPKNDWFYKKQLDAILDLEKKREFQESHEKYEQEQDELLKRLKKKAKGCK